jgi:alpha-1,6-mannosyltransferase
MKIVDVSEFYSPTGGGVRAYVDQKFKMAAKLGHDLTVIAPGKVAHVEPRDGGKIVWLETPQLPFDKNYRTFWGAADVLAAIAAEQPDVLEGSSPYTGGYYTAKWRGPAVKMLFMHADPVAVYPQTLLAGKLSSATIDRLFGWYWSYLRRLAGRYDGCVVAGNWLAERFAKYGLSHLHVVPFGVERTAFKPGLRDNALRTEMLARCGLPPEAALVLNVGRFHPEKRVSMLIDAVSTAQAAQAIGFYVVGDGFIRASIEAKARKAKHVHLAGWLKDRETLARTIASADVVLHGSSAETYGFSVAEALCCGTPVVVPDTGGAADLVDAACGETYTAGNASDAAAALIRLLHRDREALAAAAAQKAAARIGDIESHFVKLFALYADAVEQRHTATKARTVSCGCCE